MANSRLKIGRLNSPVLLFGGPYSNLAATLAMKAEAQRLHIPPQQTICTGDVVAYCAEPEATVNALRDWGIAVVMGNCEESLASSASDCGCGFEAGTQCAVLSDTWYSFSNTHLSGASRQWMGELPREIEFEIGDRSFLVVHGGVSSINQFVFPSTDQATLRAEIDNAQTDVVIGGHSGIPFGREIDHTFWLNAGVIGLPANDGTADGWYLLLEPKKNFIQAAWHRLDYPAHQATQAMHKVGLDHAYAESLLTGLWPSMDVLPDTERKQQGRPINLTPLQIPI